MFLIVKTHTATRPRAINIRARTVRAKRLIRESANQNIIIRGTRCKIRLTKSNDVKFVTRISHQGATLSNTWLHFTKIKSHFHVSFVVKYVHIKLSWINTLLWFTIARGQINVKFNGCLLPKILYTAPIFFVGFARWASYQFRSSYGGISRPNKFES